jgi:outer membrane protein assembly factor BamB
MPRSFVVSNLIVMLLACPALCAETKSIEPNWPQWRGPKRDGVSTEKGLQHEWGADGPRLAWKASGLGGGFASVSVVAGMIFTMGDRNKEQFVEALDADGGKLLWSTKISDAWKDNNYLGPRCTPTVDGDRVYAIGTYGDLVCLDRQTGAVRWKKNFAQDFGGKMMSGWGFSESPLVDGDKLVCTPGGPDATIVALNKKTGDEIWRAKVPALGDKGKDGAAYSSIVVSEADGQRQYVQLLGRGVVGISADDGKFLWGYNRIANGTANIPTPIVNGDYVFCSTGYQTGAALLKINRTDKGFEAEEVYFLDPKTLQNHHGGMVLVGDYLYGGSGHNAGFPVCVDWKSGKIVWNGGRGAGSGSAAVVYADGHLYFRYQNGVMAQIVATPKGYELKGNFEIPAADGNKKPSWPHPVVVGGKLYLREQDQLFCYDLMR